MQKQTIIRQIHNDFVSFEKRQQTNPEQLNALGFNLQNNKLIIKYQQACPNHYFISNDELIRLCMKYGLVWSEASNFTGVIPAKNVKEILAFESKILDKSVFVNTTNTEKEPIVWTTKSGRKMRASDFDDDHLQNTINFCMRNNLDYFWAIREQEKRKLSNITKFAPELYVVGTRDQFKNELEVNTEYKLVQIPKEPPKLVPMELYDDPIVLAKVRDGFIVVTMWGDDIPHEEMNKINFNLN